MTKKNELSKGEVANLEATSIEVHNIDINNITVQYHPRKHLGDLESLQASIKRDGLQEPLVVYSVGDGKYAVIDGLRRLEAVKQFGWTTVPCIVRDVKASDAAHISFVVNAERTQFDVIEVALHLKAMKEQFGYSNRDLELKGYGSPANISKKMKLLDLPEPVQVMIQNGELTEAHGHELLRLSTKEEREKMARRIKHFGWNSSNTKVRIDKYLSKGKLDDRGRIQVPDMGVPGVYIKDSRDMSEIPNEAVHLIVSSPPYNIGMEYEKGIPHEEHLEMLGAVLKECNRVMVPGGIIALNIDDIVNFKGNDGKSDIVQMRLMGHVYQNILRRHHIFLTDHIVWWKKSAAWNNRLSISYTEKREHTSYRILDNFEHVYIFRKKGEREKPPEDIVLKSMLTREQWIAWTPGVWAIPPVHYMDGHPNIYPDELVSRLVRMFSYEGDTVLDPWLGSGTTVKVARDLNRVGIGYEKEEQYKAVIMKRLGITQDGTVEGSQESMVEFYERVMAPEFSETEDEPAQSEGGEMTVTEVPMNP
ncbi:MAG: ParB/RepB/Spo0J family partition protein [Deltaproteobacteria bacterium]|nr:ParB/RepB/Spo0J family partition protein [Deltaproteobacteria bacterium]